VGPMNVVDDNEEREARDLLQAARSGDEHAEVAPSVVELR